MTYFLMNTKNVQYMHVNTYICSSFCPIFSSQFSFKNYCIVSVPDPDVHSDPDRAGSGSGKLIQIQTAGSGKLIQIQTEPDPGPVNSFRSRQSRIRIRQINSDPDRARSGSATKFPSPFIISKLSSGDRHKYLLLRFRMC